MRSGSLFITLSLALSLSTSVAVVVCAMDHYRVHSSERASWLPLICKYDAWWFNGSNRDDKLSCYARQLNAYVNMRMHMYVCI